MNMKIKQGIKYFDNTTKYGLVIAIQNNHIEILPAKPIYDENGIRKTHCYDEPNAGPEYKHNVQLKNSPDVFKALGYVIKSKHLPNVYVKADRSQKIKISETDFITKKVRIIDNGAEISDTDWKEICNHLRTTEPQKQLIHRQTPELNFDTDNKNDRQPSD